MKRSMHFLLMAIALIAMVIISFTGSISALELMQSRAPSIGQSFWRSVTPFAQKKIEVQVTGAHANAQFDHNQPTINVSDTSDVASGVPRATLARYSKAAETPQITEGMPSQALIQEIRALRRAMQDFTIGNSRLQLTIERCRLQQATVERLNDEYNGIQSQVESNEDQIRQMEEGAKNLERLYSAEADSLRRGEIEREQKNITSSVERHKQQIQQLQGRLAQVSGTLQVEKTRLAELRDVLDSLDRSFTIQQSERK